MFEDDESVVFQCGGVLLNLLKTAAADELISARLNGAELTASAWDGERLTLTPSALLPGLLYGLSAGAASSVVFIRMYAMMTMWAVWLAFALAERLTGVRLDLAGLQSRTYAFSTAPTGQRKSQ